MEQTRQNSLLPKQVWATSLAREHRAPTPSGSGGWAQGSSWCLPARPWLLHRHSRACHRLPCGRSSSPAMCDASLRVPTLGECACPLCRAFVGCNRQYGHRRLTGCLDASQQVEQHFLEKENFGGPPKSLSSVCPPGKLPALPAGPVLHPLLILSSGGQSSGWVQPRALLGLWNEQNNVLLPLGMASVGQQ